MTVDYENGECPPVHHHHHHHGVDALLKDPSPTGVDGDALISLAHEAGLLDGDATRCRELGGAGRHPIEGKRWRPRALS